MDKLIFKGLALVLLCTLLLVGCKEELYSNLAEKEANAMLAIMLKNGISCEKIPGKENTYALNVENGDIARAIELIQGQGYPQDRFATMGDIFKKEGLVSSPLEERVRYIYGLSQGISETISQIDGVLAARVHIVIPQNDPFSNKVNPSSASVFIKHRMDVDVNADLSRIKMLVVNSIEGLSYDNVTVLLFASQVPSGLSRAEGFREILGIEVKLNSITRFYMTLGILGALAVVSGAAAGALFLRLRRREADTRQVTDTGQVTDA
jgi:type III secretion protein J